MFKFLLVTNLTTGSVKEDNNLKKYVMIIADKKIHKIQWPNKI